MNEFPIIEEDGAGLLWQKFYNSLNEREQKRIEDRVFNGDIPDSTPDTYLSDMITTVEQFE
jgi:hypothetical protein